MSSTYRAYPTPTTPSQPLTSPPKDRSYPGSVHATSSYFPNASAATSNNPSNNNNSNNTSPPLTSPMQPIPPPSKKQRATPITTTYKKSSPDAATQVQEGIQKRRQELQRLRARTGNDILARARAATQQSNLGRRLGPPPNGNGNAGANGVNGVNGTSVAPPATSAYLSYRNNTSGVPASSASTGKGAAAYLSRSRPVGVPTHGSPVRNFSKPTSSGVKASIVSPPPFLSETTTSMISTPALREIKTSPEHEKKLSPSKSIVQTLSPLSKDSTPKSSPKMVTLSDLKKSVEEANSQASVTFPTEANNTSSLKKGPSASMSAAPPVTLAAPSSVPSVVPSFASMESQPSLSVVSKENKTLEPPPMNGLVSNGNQATTAPSSKGMEPEVQSQDPVELPSPKKVEMEVKKIEKAKENEPPVTPLVKDGKGKSKRELLSSLYNAASTPPDQKEKKSIASGQTNGNGKIGETKSTTTTTVPMFQPVSETVTLSSSPMNHSPPKMTNELRLLKQLNDATVTKTNSFRQVTSLNHQVTNLVNGQKDGDLATLIDISKNEGAEKAIEWAKTKLNKGGSVSLARNGIQPVWQSPSDDEDEEHDVSLRRGRASTRNSGRRKRLKSPSPIKRKTKEQSPLLDLYIASQAVEAVEDVYSSKLAKFIVRKPYGGNETMICTFLQDEYDENVSWMENVNMYVKNATVEQESTLEVVSKIGADGSILMLHGSSNVRHGTVVMGDDGYVTGYDWKELGDVDCRNEPLGRVMYIDTEGNDGEYWLDSVYEEALRIREVYCKSVFSAAVALKTTSLNGLQNPEVLDTKQPHVLTPEKLTAPKPTQDDKLPKMKMKPQMTDACVGTDDLLFVTTASNQPKADPIDPNEKVEQVQKEDIIEDNGSTDVLSSFIIFFFSSIFNLVCFILIRMPLKIALHGITMVLFSSIVYFSWVYFADDNGAHTIGAGIDLTLMNPRGIH